MPAFPLGRVGKAAVVGGFEIRNDQEQSHIVALASHQDGARQGELWAAFS